MANMSYCRFRNTLQDLQDCFAAVENMNYSREERKELYKYSREEYRAFEELVYLAKEFTEVGEELMDEFEDDIHEGKFDSEDE